MEKVQLECPVCHRVFEVDAMFAGMNCRCPVCRCDLTSPMRGDDRKTREKLTRTYKLYLWFSISSLVISVISIPATGMLMAQLYDIGQSDPNSTAMLKPTGLLLLVIMAMASMAVTALVFKCILLCRLWNLVPPEQAATTPGKAVGFLFIPFFDLYWNFVAFFKLGVFLGEKSGCASPRRLSLLFAVIPLVGIVTNLLIGAGVLFQLAASVVEILMMASFMNAVRRWRNWE